MRGCGAPHSNARDRRWPPRHLPPMDVLVNGGVRCAGYNDTFDLQAFNILNGEAVWTHTLPGSHNKRGRSVVLAEQHEPPLVIVAVNNVLGAWSLADGQMLWSTTMSHPEACSHGSHRHMDNVFWLAVVPGATGGSSGTVVTGCGDDDVDGWDVAGGLACFCRFCPWLRRRERGWASVVSTLRPQKPDALSRRRNVHRTAALAGHGQTGVGSGSGEAKAAQRARLAGCERRVGADAFGQAFGADAHAQL